MEKCIGLGGGCCLEGASWVESYEGGEAQARQNLKMEPAAVRAHGAQRTYSFVRTCTRVFACLRTRASARGWAVPGMKELEWGMGQRCCGDEPARPGLSIARPGGLGGSCEAFRGKSRADLRGAPRAVIDEGSLWTESGWRAALDGT